MRFLITGHTGFKGGWLAFLLNQFGHEVHGLSDKYEEKSLYKLARVSEIMSSDNWADIRDLKEATKIVKNIQPDFIIHLAAQSLVRRGYEKPLETFETNINGTINIIRSAYDSEVKQLLIITTDKVYKHLDSNSAFNESSELGGDDPYSQSKAIADQITQDFSKYLKGTRISIGRAGNVIGGGDYGEDRLIPDLVEAYESSKTALIRNPRAIRPWQHVLDCLFGYLLIIENMTKTGTSGIWNIGPDSQDFRTVESMCKSVSHHLEGLSWEISKEELNFKEAGKLLLDSTKIRNELNWKPLLSTDLSIEWTAQWYLRVKNGEDPQRLTRNQIDQFLAMASTKNFKN